MPDQSEMVGNTQACERDYDYAAAIANANESSKGDGDVSKSDVEATGSSKDDDIDSELVGEINVTKTSIDDAEDNNEKKENEEPAFKNGGINQRFAGELA